MGRPSLRDRVAWLALALALVGCGAPAKDAGVRQPAAEPPGSQPQAAREAEARFCCLGNEPGWSVEIRPDSIVYVGDYGDTRASFAHVAPRLGDGLWYYEAGASPPEGRARLTVLIVREPCNDGMSDQAYDYRVHLTYDLKAYFGCARRM